MKNLKYCFYTTIVFLILGCRKKTYPEFTTCTFKTIDEHTGTLIPNCKLFVSGINNKTQLHFIDSSLMTDATGEVKCPFNLVSPEINQYGSVYAKCNNYIYSAELKNDVIDFDLPGTIYMKTNTTLGLELKKTSQDLRINISPQQNISNYTNKSVLLYGSEWANDTIIYIMAPSNTEMICETYLYNWLGDYGGPFQTTILSGYNDTIYVNIQFSE